MRYLRLLWWALVAGSIIFAAGISGTWLNAQFPGDLAARYWGWLGAFLVGLSVFGGVLLTQRGQPIGWAVAGVGAAIDVLMDVQFFRAGHDLVTSLALGGFPMALAVLAGVVEGRNLVADLSARAEAEAERLRFAAEQERQRLAFQQSQAEAQAVHQRELEAMEMRARLRLAGERVRAEIARAAETPVPPARPIVDPRDSPALPGMSEVTGRDSMAQPEGAGRVGELEAYLASHPDASLRDVETDTKIPRSTAQRLAAGAGWHKNGNGWSKATSDK